MDANEYQQLAARTLLERPDKMPAQLDYQLLVTSIKRCNEMARVVEHLKKGVCHQNGVNYKWTIESLVGQLADKGLEANVPAPSEEEYMLVWNISGLIGEVGEFCDEMMRLAYNTSRALPPGSIGTIESNCTKISKESGDIMWYIAAILTKCRIMLGDAMHENIEKLKARYPEGYAAE